MRYIHDMSNTHRSLQCCAAHVHAAPDNKLRSSETLCSGRVGNASITNKNIVVSCSLQRAIARSLVLRTTGVLRQRQARPANNRNATRLHTIIEQYLRIPNASERDHVSLNTISGRVVRQLIS